MSSAKDKLELARVDAEHHLKVMKKSCDDARKVWATLTTSHEAARSLCNAINYNIKTLAEIDAFVTREGL